MTAICSKRGSTNYWGYNTIGFFAPDPRYASDVPNSLREFKEMVARFHDAGLEVILDVVYNHTAEGNELRPDACRSRASTMPATTACCPTSRAITSTTPAPGTRVNLAIRASSRWSPTACATGSSEMHVDGFRFDLGTILAREPHGFDEQSGFLKACRSGSRCSRPVKLIAEPWDCGPGGYQVGGFPPGWAEWNDKFRDTVRDFWRGEATAAALAPRLCASGDLFNHQRPPALGQRQFHHRA